MTATFISGSNGVRTPGGKKDSMSRIRSTLAIAVIALSFFIGVAPSASATPAASHSGALVGAPHGVSTQPDVLNWTPWDGFKITTLAKCKSRMAYLQKLYPDLHFMCDGPYYTDTCPPQKYWLVYVGSHYIVAERLERRAAPASTTC